MAVVGILTAIGLALLGIPLVLTLALLAALLAVVCLILVQTLYIRDVLGDKIEILGQDDE
jgi:hypothetical protein